MKKIVAKTGTYTNKDGEQKNRYQDVGVIMSNDNGEYILLNPGVNLAGLMIQQNAMDSEVRTNVMCSIFEEQGQRQAAPQQQAPQNYQQPQQGYQQPQAPQGYSNQPPQGYDNQGRR